MARKRATRAATLAGVLINQHDKWRCSDGISWGAAYAIEDIFGVEKDSNFKSLEEAVKNAVNAPRPSPIVKYNFEKHALVVSNAGCLLGGAGMTGRIIRLGKGAKIKGGKVKMQPVYRDASHAIRAKKSTKTKVVRRAKD